MDDAAAITAESPPFGARLRSRLPMLLRRVIATPTIGVGVAFVALMGGFSLALPQFSARTNLETIAVTSSVLMLVALGQTIALISGGFDLSVGGVASLGAIVFAELTGMPWEWSLVLAILCGAGFGVVNGLVIGRLRINPLITTLGMLYITGGLAQTLAHGLNIAISGPRGVLGNTSAFNLPYFSYVTLGLVIVAFFVLRYSTFGRRIYALGGNEEACRIAGIRIELVRVSVYAVCAGLAALAGVASSTQVLAASGNVGGDLTLQSFAAAVLGGASISGGIGTVPGTFLAVLILGGLADGLSIMRLSPFYAEMITGTILVVAVGMSKLAERVSRG